MQSQEMRAVGELAGEAVGGFGGLVRDMHEAIAGRTFRALGPLGAPVRVIHDGVATGVHAGVRASLRAAPRAGGALAARRARPDAPRLGSSTGGSFALAALNGAVGDVLLDRGSDLALTMTIRSGGEDVEPEPFAVAGAFPDASPRLVVFVHGLIETDEAWHVLPLRGREPGRRPYGARLRDDLGYTPVYLRYNTGRHISDNGAELSRLLTDLVAAWPVDVDEIVLVGHSMGGLVARSACHRGEADVRGLDPAVAHVFCLGAPHLGAADGEGRRRVRPDAQPAARDAPVAKLVNGRSVGSRTSVRLVRRDRLGRLRPRRVPARPRRRDAVPAQRDVLLRGSDAEPRRERAARPDPRRSAGALPERVGPRAPEEDPVRDRERRACGGPAITSIS